MPTLTAGLSEILQQRFGFPAFRPGQRPVCEAAVAGRDLLLVMPTGAGKSLCYQLPTLARGGTGLVISPLIALMDDQSSKLKQMGMKAERIHSGIDRELSREVCREYLRGNLDFLFIAPERLRIPGFAEMLAKRKPSLIAVDEAHCISQWGHDFRPDYRLLAPALELLRPAPVIALTATATPTVQQDILTQLALRDAQLFVHGFRRHNLAIEVIEVNKSQRAEKLAELLQAPESTPAIVYATSRKDAERYAEFLQSIPGKRQAAAYHAGMDASSRDHIQRSFLDGRLEVIVATIAFGMGIDKANVRTVVHTGLPGSLEGYYQEIGRAGRDGKQSRVILMHSYADSRIHEHFMQQDYPSLEEVDKLWKCLRKEPRTLESLRKSSKLEESVFTKALEKLIAHHGAIFEYTGDSEEGEAMRGDPGWPSTYRTQLDQRQEQIKLVTRYTQSRQCRMAALVAHFGDAADSRIPCGICDTCAPQHTIGSKLAPAGEMSRRIALSAIDSLRERGRGMSTGKLYEEICSRAQLTRDEFEELLGQLQQLALVTVEETSFEKDGRTIPYKVVGLTRKGQNTESLDGMELWTREVGAAKSKPRHGNAAKPVAQREAKKEDAPLTAAEQELSEMLRAWRLFEAKKTGKPAFFLFSESVLSQLARQRPATLSQLLAIPGMGPRKVELYGEAICKICRDFCG